MSVSKLWEAALIKPDATLKEAIETLQQCALRIAVVADDERRLLGTLTDGDVRRAILQSHDMKTSVSKLMCTNPLVAHPGWEREQILNLMKTRKVLQIPVVDGEGKIVGLETLESLLEEMETRLVNNPVFLMAGGFGTRLHPLTQNCPKPLLKVGDKPILEIIIENFIKAGFHKFFVSTHYLPEMVRQHFGDGDRWGVTIRYIHEETPLGTGGALGLLPHDEIDSPMLMMNGDLLTTIDYRGLLDFHNEHRGVATMCVSNYEYKVPYGVIHREGHRVLSMVEKPVHKFFINAGIYVLSPELIKSIKPNKYMDMPTLLQEQINLGKEVTLFPVHEYWLDIGRMDDYILAQKHIENLSSVR